INNMEFLNDRYASLMLTWEMGGKLLNRIPLLRKLKLREIFEFKGLWGALSDKNNPYLAQNQTSSKLLVFPENSFIMDSKVPYLEYAVGVQNILSLIQIEYVHRINYRGLPTASEHGIRFVINPSF
ncbi:MAG: carboxypeptidase-like regulatory domain-containing protein, partial [Prevotella sp.]|nr:carboxypeptidase-like regulatory domain-containing protein [Prevotella sp.]